MNCRQLHIVHLPDTVVSPWHDAFSWCQILRVVIAPICMHFGTEAFEECRSFTRVGTAQCSNHRLAPQALRSHLAQAGRSGQHTCVRSALADITIVAFRLLVALRATASLSWRGLHSYLRAEQQSCHMTRGWRTVIHWT